MGRLDCVRLGYDFFLIRFAQKDDYEAVLKKGLWFISEHFLSIRPWELYFKPSSANISSVAVWIRLNELPIEFYNAEALYQIGKAIGNVLRVDTHTSSKTRGKFARLCVQVDVDKPLINTVLIGRFEQAITHEGIHRMCFSCGRMGHRRESCLYTIRTEKDLVDKDEGDSVDRAGQSCNSHASDSPERVGGTTPEALEDNYGPWLLVSRKKAGTKVRGGEVADAGRVHAQGQKGRNAHAPATTAGTGSAPKFREPLFFARREAQAIPSKTLRGLCQERK